MEGNNSVITFLLDHGAGVDDVITGVSNHTYSVHYYYWCAINDSNINIYISVFIIFSEIIVNNANYDNYASLITYLIN